ncbi:MAG: hypothetical protein IPI62_08390 [Bacteroidetes bacterium]|nr:hypothetical protein [Bacteroidota bacterium]
MIRKCYLVSVMLMVSTLSRGQHANVQNSVVGVGTGTLIRNGSGTVNTLDTVGDPSIFGMNAWNVYAWNSTGLDSWNVNYAGYYVDTALSMNTLAYWNDGQSPSYAPDYMGQPVTDENHSFAAKRRGFPLGYYMINIPGHDDWSYLLIDGIEVWNHEDCCDYHGDVWQGFLTDTTTIEFRVMEFGGGSYGFIELIPQHVQAIATTTFIPCHNGTSTVEISASGGFPPYSGTGTFTLNAGSYEYFVVDSLGDSSLVEVNIHEPALPDSAIVTNIPTTFCEGDTITLTAPGNGSALVLSGGGPRVIIPINSPETDYTFEIDFKTTEPDAGISSVRDADLGGSFDRDLYLSGGNIFHRLYSEEVINSYSQNYADDMWHHVAVVVEAGVGQRIYVDGIMVASGSKDYSDFSWDNTLNIGFANDWFDGSIDNVRLWNVVRTQTEIEQDQTLHVIGSLPGLVGNWDFDELNGSTIYNSVDNTEGFLVDGATVLENNTNTYLWSTGDTTRSISAYSSASISVAVTTINGCAVNTATTELTMNPIPAIPAISTTTFTFCEGGSSLLNSSSSEGNQWNKNGVALIDDTSSIFNATETGNYSVTVTNAFGCSKTSLPLMITQYANPIVSTGPDMYFGECAMSYILAGGTPSGGIYSGTGVLNGIFDPSVGAGVFNIQYLFEDTNGCSSSSTSQMVVSGIPSVTLNTFANICSGAASFTLTGGSPIGGIYSGPGITNGVFDPSIGAGTYLIKYYYADSFGCGTSAAQNITVDICTGIGSLKPDELISIYPNPVHNKVNIGIALEQEVHSN